MIWSDRQLVASGGLADRLRGGRVIDAEAEWSCPRSRRSDPRHALLARSVSMTPRQSLRATCHRDRDAAARRGSALHHVSRHARPPDSSASRHAINLRSLGAAPHRELTPMLGIAVPILGGQPEPSRLGGRLAASTRVEFSQDRRDMMIDGLLGDDQPLSDVGVTQALDEQRQHLELAAVRPAGLLRVCGRGPRGTPRAPRSRNGGRRSRPPVARPVPAAHRAPGVAAVSSSAARERQRRLVRTADVPPELRGLYPLAASCDRIRLERARMDPA